MKSQKKEKGLESEPAAAVRQEQLRRGPARKPSTSDQTFAVRLNGSALPR
jgi:hypothetical protein